MGTCWVYLDWSGDAGSDPEKQMGVHWKIPWRIHLDRYRDLPWVNINLDVGRSVLHD